MPWLLSSSNEGGEPALLERAEDEHARKKVLLETVRAIEMHTVLSCIAIGILQSLSICYIGKVNSSQIRYQRTQQIFPHNLIVCSQAVCHIFYECLPL